MKNRYHNPFTRLIAGLCIALTGWLAIPIPMAALDVQPIPIETASIYGFNWRATINYTDLTNNAAVVGTLTLLPGLGNLPGTNWLIGPVAYAIETGFTNSGGTNLQFYLGFGGTVASGLATNSFFNGFDIDARNPVPANTQIGAAGFTPVLGTNLQFVATTGTNTLVAVFKATNNLSNLGAGKMHIFFRALDLTKLRNQ